MNELWVVVTKRDCPWCVKVKELLKAHGVGAFTEIDITDNETVKDFLRTILPKPSVPQVFHEGHRIGGFEATDTYLKVLGL